MGAGEGGPKRGKLLQASPGPVMGKKIKREKWQELLSSYFPSLSFPPNKHDWLYGRFTISGSSWAQRTKPRKNRSTNKMDAVSKRLRKHRMAPDTLLGWNDPYERLPCKLEKTESHIRNTFPSVPIYSSKAAYHDMDTYPANLIRPKAAISGQVLRE